MHSTMKATIMLRVVAITILYFWTMTFATLVHFSLAMNTKIILFLKNRLS